jgi:hypothetical protein
MQRLRGFTIIEVVVTCAVLVVGLMVMASTFTMNFRHATQSRDDLLAHLVMENLVEEVLAQPYGAPAPASWTAGKVVFPIVVEGRRQVTEFTRNVKVDPKLGNGSFFGGGSANTDVLSLEVTWTEASGPGPSAQAKSFSVQLTVVREP